MSNSSIFEKIFSSQIDRGNYTYSKGYLSYFIAKLGVDDEDLYNLEMFKISKYLEQRKDIILFCNNIENPNDFDTISYLKSKVINATLKIENLDVDLLSDITLNNSVKVAFDKFLEIEKNEFVNERIKQNFIIKVMSWIKMHFNDLVLEKNESPKVVFYGDIKKHEAYMLILLYLSGFDVLYLGSNNKDFKNIIDIKKYNIELEENEILSENISFEDRVVEGEVVNRASIKKATTIGAQASKRISEELLNDSGFIKPWQLQDRQVKSVILSSTIDEIPIYFSQAVKLRPGFDFDKESVYVPVFFSKINGVYEEVDEYVDLVDKLKNTESTFFIKSKGSASDISKEFERTAFNLSFLVNSDGSLDRKSLISDENYTISALNNTQKNMILEKVEDVILSDVFLDGLSKEDRVKGLYSVLYMDKRLVYMINNFDYAHINPKVVIYMNQSFIFKKEIVFLLLVLSKIGFDIVILSPNGDNCIENIINNRIVDSHRLDKMVCDFNILKAREEKTLLKKLFSKKRWM